MRPGAHDFLKALKDIVYKLVIKSPSVQHLEFKGQRMVVSTFETFMTEPKSFLPRDAYELYRDNDEPERVICDHIAGMTDSFLLKTFERLFSPRMGSIFDKL
jgi:dGTPase